MLIDRLAAIVYVLICAVGFGYWVVPTGAPRGAPPGVVMQSLAPIADTKVETQPVPMLAATAPLPVKLPLVECGAVARATSASSPNCHAGGSHTDERASVAR